MHPEQGIGRLAIFLDSRPERPPAIEPPVTVSGGSVKGPKRAVARVTPGAEGSRLGMIGTSLATGTSRLGNESAEVSSGKRMSDFILAVDFPNVKERRRGKEKNSIERERAQSYASLDCINAKTFL